MSSRKGRIARWIFRWTCRLIVLLILAVLACAIYLERAGLPDFLKRRIVAQIHARGWEVDFSRLRFHWQRGIIAENLHLQRTRHRPGPTIFVEEAGCQLNHRALRNFNVVVDSVLLRGGRVFWRFAETNQQTASFHLDKIGGELVFATNDVWQLRALGAEILGASMQISGTLSNASRLRDWRFPKSTAPPEATQALWRRIVSNATRVKFTGQPQLLTRFDGDAANIRSLDADLRFIAAAVQTPWGSATNPVLHARVYPARSDDPLQADLELTAEDAATPWGQARRVRLSWQVDPSFTRLFPTNSHIAVDLLAPETTWAKGRRVTATVRVTPGANPSAPYHTEVQATVDQFQSQWIHTDFAHIDTSIQHSTTNLLPSTFAADVHISKARSKWGEALGGVISANASLPPREQLQLFQTNLTWPERLTNIVFSSSVTASNVSSPKLEVAAGTLQTSWDSRHLCLQTALDLYGGNLTATARVDAVTREALFDAHATVDPYDVAPLLTDKARAWLSNYTWKAAPVTSVAGAVILPAWTNREPDWLGEVRPTLSLAGHFQAGEGAYREVTFKSAASPFTLTNLFWRIPDLVVECADGTIRGDYSTALATRDFHWTLECHVNPAIVRPLLSKETERKALDSFRFSEPPLIIGELWSSWDDPEQIGFNAQIVATNFVFRGETITEARTGITYTNKLLIFREPHIRQGLTEGRAPKIIIDFATQRIYFTNTAGNLDPHAIVRTIGDQATEAIAPYLFDWPPTTVVNGVLDFKTAIHDNDLHFDIKGGPFRWGQFRLQQLSGNIDWVGDKLSLNNMRGTFSSGAIGGAAAFDFAVKGAGANFAFNLGVVEADLRSFMPDIGYPTNKLEGFLNGEMIVRSANTSDQMSWQGEGKVRLRDGLIWNIPMFGIFSPVLNSVAPSMGNSRAKDASASFVISNSVLFTHDLEIRATAMRMNFDGSISFGGDIDGRMEAELLRDVPAVGFVISKVLWPITKIFEYKITGKVDHPKTESLYIIPKLLLIPFEPFKFIKDMFPEGEKPKENK